MLCLGAICTLLLSFPFTYLQNAPRLKGARVFYNPTGHAINKVKTLEKYTLILLSALGKSGPRLMQYKAIVTFSVRIQIVPR